ncbi:MAG: hypothetical protein WAS07_01365 [Micropruina sp.]
MNLAPLRLVAIGVGLTLIDIRLGGFGLSLGFIGWLVALGGLMRITAMHRGFTIARIGVLVLIAVSLLSMFLPLGSLIPLIGPLLGLVEVAVLAGICLAVADLAKHRARGVAMTSVLLLVLITAPDLLALVALGISSLTPLAVVLSGLSWLATIALAVFLWLVGDRHYLGANAL